MTPNGGWIDPDNNDNDDDDGNDDDDVASTLPTTATKHQRPKGRAPKNANKKDMEWNYSNGGWIDPDDGLRLSAYWPT